MEEEEGLKLAQDIFGTAKELSGLSSTVGRCIDSINSKRPQIAQGLGVAAKICTIVGGVSGFFPLTILGVCLAGTSAILDQDTAKDSRTNELQSVNTKLVSMKDTVEAVRKGIAKLDVKTDQVLENTEEILDYLRVDISSKLSSIEDKTNNILDLLEGDISTKLTSIEGKADGILEILKEMTHKKGLKSIQFHYKKMMEKKNKKLWAKRFNFFQVENYSSDFEISNLKAIFEYYNKNKCTEEFRELHSLILTTRIMYLEMRITYYQNHEDYNKDITELENLIFEELEDFIRDVHILKEVVTASFPYFYISSSFPEDSTFLRVFEREFPGLNEKDKRMRIWFGAQYSSLAEGIEGSIPMLNFLDNTSGPNPLSVLNQCYRQIGVVLLKDRLKGSEKKSKDFLEFMQEDRDSFTAEAAASFDRLKAKQDKIQSALNTTLRLFQQHWPFSNFKWILDKAEGLISESDKLPLWASKFHRGLSDFDVKNSDFKEYQIKEFLRNVYSKKCDNSLEPLDHAHRFLIYVRALYCLLKLTYMAHVPKKLLEELPGFNPVEEALEEIEATELCVRKFTDVCNSVLSGFFEAALTAKPHLCYVPDFADIPRTDQNFVENECWETLQYGGSYNQKKNIKVYQTEQVPGFARLYDTDTKQESICRFQDNKLQDGGYRVIFNNGDSCFGQIKFDKSPDYGEENRIYRLFKYASGDIEYEEKIWVNGQDEDWRYLTRYTFNPDKLEWNNDL